jgi:hypothetical protein
MKINGWKPSQWFVQSRFVYPFAAVVLIGGLWAVNMVRKNRQR